MKETKEMTTEEKVAEFEKELRVLLDKYDLDMTMTMDFPQYKVLPTRVQLALEVLAGENMRYQSTYKLKVESPQMKDIKSQMAEKLKEK